MKITIEVWESGYGHVEIDVPENADYDTKREAIINALQSGAYNANETTYSYEADIEATGNWDSVIG